MYFIFSVGVCSGDNMVHWSTFIVMKLNNTEEQEIEGQRQKTEQQGDQRV